MQIAIITGASSGLGKVFFEKIVERYPQLDEYWVIARSENKLKELAEQHPQQKVRVVPLDLSDTRSMDLSKITQDQMNFIAQRNNPGGKKTMKAYYWYICGQEWDAQHPHD